MADFIDSQAVWLIQSMHKSIYSGTVSTKRLGQIALELVAMRTAYEGVLASDAAHSRKKEAREVLRRVEEMEKLVARLYAVSRVRVGSPYAFSPPLITVTP